MSIKLSPKHGVNPTIGICMWCGKPTDEIALVGKLPKDAEAPRYSVLNYNPCKECKSFWDKGVVFVECSYENPNNIMPFTKDNEGCEVFPTGNVSVVTQEAAERILNRPFELGTVCAVDVALYERLGLNPKETNDAGSKN